MHIDIHLGRRHMMLIAGAVLALAVGGTAYATIPDGNAVYTACMLNGIGTIRLIDPSGPSSSLLSRCTRLETQITWSQKGPKGDTGAPGLPGTNGTNGANGISPTVKQLSAGDPHCAAGGAAITDASGTTAYVCNGQDGKDGQSFTGTFTSPNQLFSLSVANDGVQISGPDSQVSLPSTGGVSVASNGTVSVKGDRVETVANDETITVHHDRTETVDNNENITVGGNRTQTVDSNENIMVGGNRTETVGNDENVKVQADRTETVGNKETISIQGDRTETVGGNQTVQVGGTLNLRGGLVGINGVGGVCRPAARVLDMIDPVGDVILTGSATVCIG